MARPRTDISPRILNAAAIRFSQSGVDAASLRSIAKDAGTSVGMVYYYFPTKDALFFAVVEEVYAKLLADMAAALSAEGTLEQRIRALYARLGNLAQEERRVLRLVALEAVAGSTRFLGLIERFKGGHVALVFRLVAEGMGGGTLRTDLNPFVIAASIITLGTVPQVVFQVAGEHLPLIPKFSQEVFVSELAEALFHGVAPP